MKTSTRLLLTLNEGVGGATAVARAFTAQMAAGSSDLVLAMLSDSTANAYNEHFFRFLNERLLPAFPAYLGQYLLWSDASQSYDVNTVDFGGVMNPVAGSTLFQDTFDRADGALGTATSGGQTWAANSYTISGNKAVPAGASPPDIGADIANDKIILSADVTIQATTDYRIYGLFSAGNGRAIFCSLNTTGVTLFGNFGAGNVTLASASISGLTVGKAFNLKLVIDGLFVGVVVNGRSVGLSLSSAQKTALGSNARARMTGMATTGIIDNFTIAAIANTRRLKIYNASVAGKTIDYHDQIIGSVLPERPDLLMVSLGHNNDGTDTAAQYLARLDDLVADARALYPGLPIIATAQNARTDASAAAAAERFAALRGGWASRGWGFIDVETAFTNDPGGVAALLEGDGIHPNTTTGCTLWINTEAAHFGVA